MIFLKKRDRLSRRNLIKNTAALALAAPVFRHIESAHGQAPSPRRLMCFFSGNGPMVHQGPARATSNGFELTEWYQGLEPHRDVATFISHLSSTSAGNSSNAGHDGESQAFDGYGCNDRSVQGPSIHHLIEQKMREENRLAPVPSVVWGNMATTFGRDVFATGVGRDVRPTDNPRDAWAEVFANFIAPNPDPIVIEQAEEAIRRRQSLLDFAWNDCKSLQNQVGAEGMQLLENHCTRIREAELALESSINRGSCEELPRSESIGGRDNDRRDQQVEVFNQLMAATLACELTHLICFQMEPPGGTPYQIPGSNNDHHHYTHESNSASKTAALRQFIDFHIWQINGMVDLLKSTTDLQGNPLIDSTMLHWKTGLGGHETNGYAHLEVCCIDVLYGHGQGTFKTNNYFRGSSPDRGKSGAGWPQGGREAAQILLAMKHYMGLYDNFVGDTRNIEPLPELYL